MMTGSPVIANVDGGNDLEIIAVTSDYTFLPAPFSCNTAGNKVFVYKQNGQLLPGWPQTVVCPPEATPAVGDVDGDGSPEIIVPTNGQDPLLYVFKRDGTQLTGWPQTTGGFFMPALADIDKNDGGKLEIITTSSDGNLYVFNHDGTSVPGWPLQLTRPFNSPVVADLDGDLYPEIIIADNFKLYVLNRNGTPFPGWSGGRQLPNDNRQVPVTVADLDGDGRKEILLVSPGMPPTTVYGFRFNGTTMPNFPKQLPSVITASLYPFSLAIGDFNGNGVIDAFMLDNSEDGYMYLWEFSGPASPQALSQWPQFHHDPQHTGLYKDFIPQQ